MPKTYEYGEAESRRTERTYQSPEIVRQRVAILDTLNLQVGERVIDVGCGPGLLTQEMALAVGENGRVVGIDTSEAMLDIARRRCEGLDQIRIANGDAITIEEKDDSFDAVACVQVLLYVPSVKDAIAEIYRVLRPGGRLVIMETDWRGTVLNSSDESLTRKIISSWDLDVPSPGLPVRMSPMLRQHGFRAIRVHALPIVSTSYNPDGFSVVMMKQFAECAKKHGIADRLKTDAWLEELKRLDEEMSYFFCVNRFLFSAIKI